MSWLFASGGRSTGDSASAFPVNILHVVMCIWCLSYHIPQPLNSLLPRTAAAAAKSLQSCPTLCNPTDGRPPGSPVPAILQARTLECVAMSFSKAWKWKVKVKSLSRVRLLATPWIAAYQAPPSMEFSRQEYWSGLPLPSPFPGLLELKWVCPVPYTVAERKPGNFCAGAVQTLCIRSSRWTQAEEMKTFQNVLLSFQPNLLISTCIFHSVERYHNALWLWCEFMTFSCSRLWQLQWWWRCLSQSDVKNRCHPPP